MREFDTGATRSSGGDKPEFGGFISWRALRTFGAYMHAHRKQQDGQLRDSDNWKKGIPQRDYVESLSRHYVDLMFMLLEDGRPVNPDTGEPATAIDLCCALAFNVQGLLDTLLQQRETQRPEAAAPMPLEVCAPFPDSREMVETEGPNDHPVPF